jgi:signal transduction histidine kinase
VLLALIAGFALARDHRAARADAARRAGDLAEIAHRRIGAFLDGEVGSRLPASPNPGAHPETSFAPAAFTLGPSNELLHPLPIPWPPVVSSNDTNSQRNRDPDWNAAANALDAGAVREALEAYDRLLQRLETQAAGGSQSKEARELPVGWPSHDRARVLFERALALERAGRTNDLIPEFQKVFETARESDTTEAGLSLVQLSALRTLHAATGQAALLPKSWVHQPELLIRRVAEAPGPFAEDFFQTLRPLLPELLARRTNPPPLELSDLEAIHRQPERARQLYALALRQQTAGSRWPTAFWLHNATNDWLALEGFGDTSPPRPEPAPAPAPTRTFQLFSSNQIVAKLESSIREADPRGEFLVRWRIGERDVRARCGTPKGPNAPPLEQGFPADELVTLQKPSPGGLPVVLGVSLQDPASFFSQQRRRTLLFAGLLLAAVLLAARSVVSTHRSLVRQHELNLQKSNFVSSVSHELRAPLGSIRLLAEGLERGTVTDADRRLEYFRLIGQETRRLGSLVENVLDFSRIEQGRKQYEFEPTRIDALLHRTVETFEPLAKERGVRLEVVVPDSGPPLELPADGRALQQALLNLLDNALKHSPEGARIRVQLEVRPAPSNEGESATAFSQLRLSVTDSGPGIPAADHERIFEPFFRRGSELRRDTQGVGIGLSIVRHILEAHGGRIDLVSQPGQGATFTLVLPVPSSTPTLTPTPCDS